MKTNELRDLNKDDLMQKLSASYDEINMLNYQKRIGSLDKPHKFRVVRKDIARIKTILKELETKEKT